MAAGSPNTAAEGLCFESHSKPWLNAFLLFTQQWMGNLVATLERDKGSKEMNWLPYLTCHWLRIDILSNRHSSYIQKYTGLPFLQEQMQ